MSNDTNYELYRINQRLKGSLLAQEDIKVFLNENIFISRIGTIKEFDSNTQKGIVLLKEYEGLAIHTCNIASVNYFLKTGDEVILLQSSINIFNTDDNNYFDQNYYYILRPVDLSKQKIEVKAGKVAIRSSDPIEISTSLANLKESFKQIVSTLEEVVDALFNLKVIGQAEIDPTFRVFYVNKIRYSLERIMPLVNNTLK
ncbi:hypothetical protein CR532_05280 (plasmid) [Candidatus Borreliella tachyglossi]|uniref:Uncharacterized protein n=1 Tax=Candidatus Borreliella tachyglossi TaxID=1964448 RepID=A0A2S1LYN0_9SPIR|nr:DUF777 family protein [Candidatus Borreliella tachyglossi]AWG43349.1 hypothetical protein CR532_04950 [Candidatus Borreliella tachyglossi]AWG43408.1 hypothetical protein CR532_05280 [Candidatus Borreliella tachyglossi]